MVCALPSFVHPSRPGWSCGSRPTAENPEPIGFEDQCRQPVLALCLMILARGPEDCFARRDRLELTVGSAHASGTLENREDLRNGGRVTDNPSIRSETKDRRLHGRSSGERRRQRGDRETVEEILARCERYICAKTQSFQIPLESYFTLSAGASRSWAT